MPVQVKICGLSTPETLDASLRGGASHVGFVFFPKSPRNVSHDQAQGLARRVQGRAKMVGLFVDPEPDTVAHYALQLRLDVIQLHGGERPQLLAQLKASTGCEVWKAVPVRTASDLARANDYAGAADAVLYDAKPAAGSELPGGNGLRFDWSLLQGRRHPLPWLLSGGLDAANLAEAIRVTGATLVDVSSGVESAPGVKDVDKIAAFLKAASQL